MRDVGGAHARRDAGGLRGSPEADPREDAPRSSSPVAPWTLTSAPSRTADGERLHSLFYTGVGMFALPAAEVCSTPGAPCQPGETSLSVSLSALLRWGRIAAGADADVAFGLRPEKSVRAPGREHVRSYYCFHALFRYLFPVTRRLEWWTGASLGAVVLSDTWSTPSDREPYADIRTIGPERLSLRSEGLSLGPSIGAHYRFRDRWLVGSQFRYLNWFLPTERAVTPFDDTASLAGRVDVFELAVFLGFRAGQ
ncbi:MAG: hypothetical protein FJ095_01970 [Deltaproteobacteria bacterium]|nr:hypothetical protein [Deltaproteobacteria bacterium]